MRILILLAGFCIHIHSLAQAPPKLLRLQVSYEKPGQYLEQAVELIEATNKVGLGMAAQYMAGQAVVLSPGFEARSGSSFIAEIRPVIESDELSLSLKVFPNPFEQSTLIDYFLPSDGKVNLWITDTQGKVIGKLIQNETQSAGKQQIEWKAESLNAGTYILVLESNQQKAVSRAVKK